MQLEQQVDKILSVVLDNQAKLGGLDQRITGLGSRYQRLEERIAVLESR